MDDLASSTGDRPRVLIVGGGIAGLCLDLALRDAPWQVELVERDTDRNRLGAGLAIQPNAMRALRALGVGSAVERAGSVISRFQYRDQRGALLCDIDLHELWGDVGPFVGITRTALNNALGGGRSKLRVGTAVTSLSQRSAVSGASRSAVSVSFDDDSSAEYDLVVGADGINSQVRRSALNLPDPSYGGQMAWRSVAPTHPDVPDAVQFWLGEDRFFGVCPAGEGTTYGFGNVAGARSHEPAAGRQRRLLEGFAGFATPVRDYLAAVAGDGDIHCSPIEWLPQVAWGDSRVVLIGDAAHAMSPMMGQGGCMAIEDACVLADELRRNPTISGALAAFVTRRDARVEWVREQSRALGELVRAPAHTRNQALRKCGRAAFHHRYRPLAAAP